MKLQQHYAYKYKDRVNYKYVIVVPNDIIEKLGWSVGQELKMEVDGKKLVVKLFGRMSYTDFRNHIENILRENPNGLTWNSIREKIGFYQKVPNNKWVANLEKDIGLIRKKMGNKTVWKLG